MAFVIVDKVVKWFSDGKKQKKTPKLSYKKGGIALLGLFYACSMVILRLFLP